jgi:hypothetical protein
MIDQQAWIGKPCANDATPTWMVAADRVAGGRLFCLHCQQIVVELEAQVWQLTGWRRAGAGPVPERAKAIRLPNSLGSHGY